MPSKSPRNKKTESSEIPYSITEASSHYCDASINSNPFIKTNQLDPDLAFLIGDKIPRSTKVRRDNTDFDNLNDLI